MHLNKLGRIASIAAAAAIVASACSSSAATQSPTANAPTAAGSSAAASVNPADLHFCWMIFDTSIPFYTNLIKGANDQAAKLGVKLDIVNGTAELTGQIAVVQQFITQKCSAIIISTSDSKGIVPVVQQANAAKIPVFAVNLGVAEGAITYIGVDDYQFGVNQGKLLLQALPNGGKVGYIDGKMGVDAQIKRKAGLMDTIKDHSNIQIVAEQSANWDNSQALAITQDWLNKYPKGQIDAIVDQGPEGSTAAKYVSENGRSEIKYIVGDFPQSVKDGIAAGYVYGTTDQDPYPQGTGGVQAAYDWLTGNKSAVKQPQMLLDLPIVTKDNVDKYPAAWNG